MILDRRRALFRHGTAGTGTEKKFPQALRSDSMKSADTTVDDPDGSRPVGPLHLGRWRQAPFVWVNDRK